MRSFFVLAVFGLGCGQVVASALETTDGAIVVADAGTAAADAGVVTFERQIQPLFMAKCSRCHEGNGGLPAFSISYAPLLQPSTLCPGERVGECVKWALQAQVPEGDRCRTTVVRPFHREGWICLTPDEIQLVVGWIDSGMLER